MADKNKRLKLRKPTKKECLYTAGALLAADILAPQLGVGREVIVPLAQSLIELIVSLF